MRSKIKGWDERDYMLWSEILKLPSYGLVGGRSDNPLISRQDLIAIMHKQANDRHNEAFRRFMDEDEPKPKRLRP